ncbi:hypothetical protein S40285_01414 [Stachybotrys chlorohalonatus IBT 40285]|uniref:Methyltransferase domain-containing protein n=1 Tax=Stachybotrys chlorohalonatus (strain IBT 40285) TaxID=1283841 RepID=A0A084QLJ0_STAC4|nr:hypothetical protein S40285_01414 [Stachybotrys chlorohalonata IBT 40285]
MSEWIAPPDVKQRLKESYDAVAVKYNDWTQRHHTLRATWLDELYRHVPRLTEDGAALLELGCGAGLPILTTACERNGKLQVTANDLSPKQLELARSNLAAVDNGRVKYIAGDMTELTFADNSLTAVVALYTLIHLPAEEQVAMLGKIGKWLEPGGCMLANLSAVKMPGVIMEEWLEPKGWMYWSGLGKEETMKAMDAAGLKVEVEAVQGDAEESFLWLIARKPPASETAAQGI